MSDRRKSSNQRVATSPAVSDQAGPSSQSGLPGPLRPWTTWERFGSVSEFVYAADLWQFLQKSKDASPSRLLKNHYRGVISSLFVRLMKRFGRLSWGFRGPDAA
jgi:hypothetical protein